MPNCVMAKNKMVISGSANTSSALRIAPRRKGRGVPDMCDARCGRGDLPNRECRSETLSGVVLWFMTKSSRDGVCDLRHAAGAACEPVSAEIPR